MSQIHLDLGSTPLPPNITVLTHTEPVKGLVCPFDPEVYSDVDANGDPYMSIHGVYLGDEYIGVIFRLYPDTPWTYAFRGAINDRTGGNNFKECVAKLIHWRAEYLADLENMFSDSKRLADWIEQAKADDRAARSAQLALAKKEDKRKAS